MRRRKTAWKEKARRLLLAAKDFSPYVDYPPHSRGIGCAPSLVQAVRQGSHRRPKRMPRTGGSRSSTRRRSASGDRDQAVENVNERRPTGLMSLGASDAVVREYWLKCDAAESKNQESGRTGRARRISPSRAR